MNESINTNKFLRHWLLNSVTVWIYTMVMGVAVYFPLAMLFNIFSDSGPISELILILVALFAFLLLPGAVVGYCIGEAQYGLLRDMLGWRLQHWRRMTTIGGMLGGSFVMLMLTIMQPDQVENVGVLLVMPVMMFVLSSFQAWVLRHKVQPVWLWVLGNVVGGLAFSGVLFMNTPGGDDGLAFLFSVLSLWLLAALAQGFLTGYVMVWLYETVQPESELAYAPVPVEIEQPIKNPNHKPSVWDDAI